MKRLRVWVLRLAGMLPNQRRERELADELEAHLQMHIDDNIRSGMTRDQARRNAMLKLGGVEAAKQIYRERRSVPFLDHLVQDLRFAGRQLARNPGFTAVAVLMVTLGMGASVAIYGFVDSTLIEPLPYAKPTRLVHVTESAALMPRANLSHQDYIDWKKMNTVFSSMDAYNGTGYLLKTPTGTQPVPGVRVSDGFFRTLGVIPALGRDFYAGEDSPGKPNTVLVSYGAWQRRFGGKTDIVGRAIQLSGVPYTVVGVLPQKFHFAPRGDAEMWATLHAGNSNSCELRRSCHDLEGIGRLKDGVTVEAALANMALIAKQLEKQYPDSNRDQGASVIPLAELIVGDVRPILLMLLGGAGLLLLIACINVASLLLARSDSRRREIALRGALGASSLRLAQQFAIEGLVLVLASSVLGLLSAQWGMKLLLALIPAEMLAGMPALSGLGFNLRVLAFASMVSLLTAVLFALAPLSRVSVSGLRDGLSEASRGSAGTSWRRFGSNLVVLELSLAMVLLVGAGLLGQSFYRLLHVDLGFEPDHLATLSVAAPDATYAKDEQAMELGRQVLSRVSNLPGVRSAGIGTLLPISGNGNTDWIRFVGRPYSGEHNEVNGRDVSSEYFTTLKAKLIRGRYFTDADDSSKPQVAIINRKLAAQYFPGEDPIGKQFGDTSLTPKSIKTIVGIVDDIKEGSLDSAIWPAVYRPFNQSPSTYFGVVVRSSQAEESVLRTLGPAIRQLDPNLGTIEEQTMAARINDSPTAYLHRSSAWLVGGFAVLALLLGVVGLYGVIAYSVSQRTREIGVRMALGAQTGTVYRLILGEAGRLTVAGLALGLLCSLAMAALMKGLLFGVQSWDVPTLLGVALVLSTASLLASYLPARQAASVNPVDALRAE